MTQTLVIACLAATLLGLCPTATAADCSPFEPGSPDGGAVGAAQWYALQNAYLACQSGNALQASAEQNGGAIEAKLLSVSGGALALLNTGGLAPAASAFQAGATAAGISEAHDGCGAIAGDANPACGSDPTVSQDQACPSDAAIPNPIGGGLAGNTLANANGVLQASCALGNAAAASIPSQNQVTDYEEATQATLLSLNGDLFAIGSDALNTACIYLTGNNPCV